ncbi:hypothetical protein ACHAXR_012883 [Thalassiosira sp. AJA248-18]
MRLLMILSIASSFQLSALPARSTNRNNPQSVCLLPGGIDGKTAASTSLDHQRNRDATETIDIACNHRKHQQHQPHHDVGDEVQQPKTESPSIQDRRRLGSMEQFMLPRPVGPETKSTSNHERKEGGKQHQQYMRPPMNHIVAFILSSTPSTWALRLALDNAVRTHPLLRARPRPVGPETKSTSNHERKEGGKQHQQYMRPPMNHIVAFILSSTPSTWALRLALDNAVRTHPLLRARVNGDGYPNKYLDPMRRMVRWTGWSAEEENPLEFVVYSGDDKDISHDECATLPPKYWGGSLRIVNIPGTTRQDLDSSWQSRFEHDLDSDTVVSVVDGGIDTAKDLWKLELHRLFNNDTKNDDAHQGDMPGTQCALVLTMNHAISDQGSVNQILDQILSDVAELEDESSRTTVLETSIKHPSIVQPVPPCLESSLLGRKADTSLDQRTTMRLSILDVIKSPFSSPLKGIMSRALRQIQCALKLPTLFPSHKPSIVDILDQASILLFGSPLIQIDDTFHRRSNIEYRTLPVETTLALVKKSKGRRVPISMTLAAAVAVTCADTFGDESNEQSRIYKILQSLDTRRFPGATDSGDTLSCQAGGMDLCLTVPGNLGRKIRHHSETESSNSNEGVGQLTSEGVSQTIEQFWMVAKQCYDQTSSFLKGSDAVKSVQTFDLGMNICDIGRIVEAYAKSKASKARAWSAGITNVGEYERQKSVLREGAPERGHLLAVHGTYQLEDAFYATSHARVGATFPVGCITVGGKMSITINPPWPLVSKKESEKFADAFIGLLGVIAETEI